MTTKYKKKIKLIIVSALVVTMQITNGYFALPAQAAAHILTETTPVPSPTNISNPTYEFNSSTIGTIVYGGDCVGDSTLAWPGTNTITFDSMSDGLHNNCTIVVASGGQVSNILNVSPFTIDTVAPTITVDTISTSNVSPALSGTIDEPGATMSITILNSNSDVVFSGSAVNNADGTWTLPAGSIVPGLAIGTYDVQVSAIDLAGNFEHDNSTNELTVAQSSLATISISPASSSIVAGHTQQFTAVALNQNGSAINPTPAISWSSSDPSIANVNANGLVTGVTAGTVTITAADSATGLISSTANVDVTTLNFALSISVDFQTFNTSTPTITGTISDPTASVWFDINDSQGNWVFGDIGINNGDGTWSGQITTPLPDDVYDIISNAQDANNNAAFDDTLNELTIITQAPTAINIIPNTATIDVGTTQQFTAEALDQNGSAINPTPAINWSSSDPTIASVNANGLVSGMATGTVTITASDAATGLISASASITVNAPQVTAAPILTEITPIPDPTNNPTPDYTFSSDQDGTITYGGDCTASGFTDALAGSNTITFDALADGTYSNCTITVTNTNGEVSNVLNVSPFTVDTVAPIVSVDSLTTSNPSPELTGSVDDPTATISIDMFDSNFNDIFNGSAINNSDGTWILPAGTITPDLAPGTYDVQVTATDAAGNVGYDDTFDELVITAPQPQVLTSIEVTPVDPTINVGDTQQFTAVALDQNGTPLVDQPVFNWSSDNTNTGTVDSTGLFTALAVGATVISATSGSVSGTSTATVIESAGGLDTLFLLPDTATLNVGQTLQLEATAFDINGNVLPTPALVWSSDNPTVADVDANGLVTALATGTATITAADTATGLISGTSNITVTDQQNTVPNITVDFLTTDIATPTITGMVDDLTASISIVVNGITYAGTNDGAGGWSAAVTDALADGTYDVIASATNANGTGVDNTNGELTVNTTIDLIAPVVTVDTLITTIASPEITGTIDDPTAILDVIITNSIGQEIYFGNPINNGDGTWTLPAGNIPDLAPDTYGVEITATDASSNIGTDGTTGELIINQAPPLAITVDTQTANSSYPVITGTITDPTASIWVDILDANGFWVFGDAALNNGDGTWTLSIINNPLTDGIYDISVFAEDANFNSATDNTTNELTVQANNQTLTSISISPNPVNITEGATQQLNAVALDEFGGQMNVPITWSSSDDFIATVDANGLVSAVSVGTVTITASNGNISGNATVFVEAAQNTAPVLTEITPVPDLTNIATPTYEFSSDQDGVITYSGDCTSSSNAMAIAGNNVITFDSLPDGLHSNCIISVTNASGLTSTLNVTAFTIDTTAPAITVDSITTIDTSPSLSGTIDDPNATITVSVIDSNLNTVFSGPAVNNGDGTWSLAAGSIDPVLALGTYDIEANATDLAGNMGYDLTWGELTITDVLPTISSLDVTPASQTISVGTNLQLTATAFDQNGNVITPTPALTWSSDNPFVADVDANGLVNAISEGTAIITVYDAATGLVSASSTITVTAAQQPTLLTITPENPTIAVGETVQLTATAFDQNGNEIIPTPDLFWESSDTFIATVDNTGLVTGISEGVVTIAATDTATGLMANTTVTVTGEAPILTSLFITPENPTIAAGETVQLTATAFDQNGNEIIPTPDLFWESSDTSIATVDNTGLVTGVSPGTVTITATDVATGLVSANTTVTVTGEAPILASLFITPENPTIAVGETVQLTATAFDQNGNEIIPTPDLFWESSDTSIATVDNTGLVTGVSPGTVTITATDVATGLVSANTTVTVTGEAPVLTEIVITPSDSTIAVEQTVQLTAALLDQFGNPIIDDVIWESSDPSVAQVDSNGLVTGISPGTVTITASSGDVSGTATVTVTSEETPILTSLFITPENPTIAVGETVQLTATALDQNGNEITTPDLFWESSDTSIATVDNTGLVTGVSPGTVTITATDVATGLVSASTTVTVTSANPEGEGTKDNPIIRDCDRHGCTIEWNTSDPEPTIIRYSTKRKSLKGRHVWKVRVIKNLEPTTHHVVHFRHLKKNTRYYFRIVTLSEDGERTLTKILSFRTTRH